MEKSIVIFSTGRSGHNWVANLMRSWLPRDYVVRKMESEPPNRYDEVMYGRHGELYDPEWPVIVLVRDYLNWAASWIKHEYNSNSVSVPERIMQRADIWYAVCKEGFYDTSYIKNKTLINYDWMTADRNYRMELCNQFGGNYNESKLNHVTHQGEGSSFDGVRYQNHASEMMVRERWRWFLSEEGEPYQCYLSLRPEILEYYIDNWELPDSKLRLCETIMSRAKL